MTEYVALLRGINVGGRNVIRMSELRDCFVTCGFEDAATYIQTGNVLFSSRETDRDALARLIEDALGSTFSYRATIVLRSLKEMRAVVARAPAGFGTRPTHYRYDALFLKEPLTSKQALPSVPVKAGVDEVQAGPGVLYFSRLISRAAQSQLSKLVAQPIYQSITIRNWNTTTKLMRLMEERAA